MDDDTLTLIPDDLDEVQPTAGAWVIAVIDDDPAVHDGTRYALASYTLGQVSDDRHEACRAFGRALEILQPLAQHPGIAPGGLQLDTVRAALRRCG